MTTSRIKQGVDHQQRTALEHTRLLISEERAFLHGECINLNSSDSSLAFLRLSDQIEHFITAINWGNYTVPLMLTNSSLPAQAQVRICIDITNLAVDSMVSLNKFQLGPQQAVLLSFPYAGTSPLESMTLSGILTVTNREQQRVMTQAGLNDRNWILSLRLSAAVAPCEYRVEESRMATTLPPTTLQPPSNVMSFPLVLSPPPTPLPPHSFSPPKRPGHCVPGQILSQSQMQTQIDGALQFFPLSSPSTSRFNHPIWLQLPSEDTESVDLIQSLSQDSNPSLVYSEHAEPPLKQQSQQKSTDGLLSFNPALAQHLHPQSCVQLQLGHEPLISEDHMSWSQNVPIAVYTGAPFNSVIQLGRELMETWEGIVSHYTPPPMLNPTRSGTGLFYNLLPPFAVENRALWNDERKDNVSHRSINIGLDFQAELPDLLEEIWPEEPVKEELLWKPWEELEQSDNVLQHATPNPDPPSEPHFDPKPYSKSGPVTNPAGIAPEHKDRVHAQAAVPIICSHAKSTDCAQSTYLTTSHWTSDMGLPAQPKDRWPVL
ncbi:Transcriptional-regulating factor 1 [Triplophysa tibetana]|uniref:Transcriptional-regulating factor 1 n=1 Tax=Triplophysa tibetana TaxID=1572043 RepID=A0A5A9PPK7_9TELE|nr:Transcriptional-regulating factor 1 [Triplophysa tibetana]